VWISKNGSRESIARSALSTGRMIASGRFRVRTCKMKGSVGRGMTLTQDRIILNAGERTGNIWMAEYSAR
jgi:hypothetical protein